MPHYSQQNWRKFCQTLQHKEAADKFLSSDVGEKIRWTKPQDNADEFASAIVRARNVKDKDDLVKNPLDELEKAEVALSKVEHAMNTTQATEIKKKIKNEGGEAVMKRIDSHIAVIKKKLKQN